MLGQLPYQKLIDLLPSITVEPFKFENWGGSWIVSGGSPSVFNKLGHIDRISYHLGIVPVWDDRVIEWSEQAIFDWISWGLMLWIQHEIRERLMYITTAEFEIAQYESNFFEPHEKYTDIPYLEEQLLGLLAAVGLLA